MRRSRRLVAAFSTITLVPGLVALQAVGQASSAAPPWCARRCRCCARPTACRARTITRHDARHPAHRRQGLRLARASVGVRRPRRPAICTLADTVLTGPRPALALPRSRRRRYDDQVSHDRHQPADRHAGHRPARPPVVEKLLADPKAGPGAEARADGRRLRRRREQVPPTTIGGASNDHRPGVPRRGVRQARTPPRLDIWYGVYARQPARLRPAYFVPQIADATPPSADRPRAAAAAGLAPVRRSRRRSCPTRRR